jgi:hypothetical protein
MDDPVRVQRVEARRDVRDQAPELRQADRAFGPDAIVQRAPADMRGGEVAAAVFRATVSSPGALSARKTMPIAP